MALAAAATAEVIQDGPVLRVRGVLDVAGAMAVRASGEALIRAGSGPLTIDLGESPVAHSAALSLFLCWQRCAQSQQRPLNFVEVGESLRSLASLSGVDHYLSGFTAESH
ncbi:STAS domain-containing protein [Marinobacter mobilis]|uniref:Phospholipid transport system transporter-binding protein n=1 Tax=Marinobacter mobilis TaxID=488533 RepID=A0A1H2TG06_9GAMM|nr:STAS domain-containing protein [Marinobacter mobilis]SDW42851.1 phospholipid transport system transporter-binding protein [Marinobacter mobilis]